MKIPHLLPLLVLLPALLPAEAPAPAAGGSCCSERAAGTYSRDSLYQMESSFENDEGKPVALGSLRGRPVVLVMFYSSCTYACPLLLADVMRLRETLPAAERGQASYVFVSFDVERDTPASLRQFRETRSLDGSWQLLHGNDAAVRELAALLGVKYVREKDGTFSHSNLITLLNREGEIAHQQTGLQAPVAPTAEVLHRLIAGGGGAE